jgi:hypothetical protein
LAQTQRVVALISRATGRPIGALDTTADEGEDVAEIETVIAAVEDGGSAEAA